MLQHIIGNTADALILILFFGASIFIHELGHFLVALKLGFVIDTFSIGFGPAIWKKKFKGIDFKIGILPLGGYVAIPQLDPTGMATVQGVSEDGKEVTHRELPEISPWKKIAVAFAGAAGNIVLALVFACIIWLSPAATTYKGVAVINSVAADSAVYKDGIRAGDEVVALNGKPVATWNDVNVELLLTGKAKTAELSIMSGKQEKTVTVELEEQKDAAIPALAGIEQQTTPCILKSIVPNSPAEKAGLQENDIVISFDGIPVTDAPGFIKLVAVRGGKEVPMTVERDKKTVKVKVTPAFNKELDQALIGVRPTDLIFPWMQEKKPLAQIKADAAGIFRLLKALVTPKESAHAASGLGGPVMIIAALWVAIKISLFNAIGFLRFLNVNLAILNLLPIPVLDGGHIMFSLWEAVTKRKVNPQVVNALVNVFAVLLIGVFLILTTRDVRNVKKMLGHSKSQAAATNTVMTVTNTTATAAATNTVPVPEPPK